MTISKPTIQSSALAAIAHRDLLRITPWLKSTWVWTPWFLFDDAFSPKELYRPGAFPTPSSYNSTPLHLTILSNILNTTHILAVWTLEKGVILLPHYETAPSSAMRVDQTGTRDYLAWGKGIPRWCHQDSPWATDSSERAKLRSSLVASPPLAQDILVRAVHWGGRRLDHRSAVVWGLGNVKHARCDMQGRSMLLIRAANR